MHAFASKVAERLSDSSDSTDLEMESKTFSKSVKAKRSLLSESASECTLNCVNLDSAPNKFLYCFVFYCFLCVFVHDSSSSSSSSYYYYYHGRTATIL